MWTESAGLEPLSFADRWHYLCMIQHCSRAGKVDGIMRMIDARRCSDHPDPDAAVQNLAAAGLVKPHGSTVQVVHIDDHIPPPSVRHKAAADRVRKQRQRKHQDGDHSMCLPAHCDHAPSIPVTADVTRDETSDPGTGQDRTGQDMNSPPEHEFVALEPGSSPASGWSLDDSPADPFDSLGAEPDSPAQPDSAPHPPGCPCAPCWASRAATWQRELA